MSGLFSSLCASRRSRSALYATLALALLFYVFSSSSGRDTIAKTIYMTGSNAQRAAVYNRTLGVRNAMACSGTRALTSIPV